MKQLAFKVDRIRVPDAKTAQRVTIDLIAKCIRNAQSYLPIRNLAASVAARAAPKDYLGQLKAIYDDFLTRWRYVKDPVGVETLAASPRAVFYLVLNADGRGAGGGMGVGDCDDAACAIGSELSAIGMPVRIATTRSPSSTRGLFSHIFIQAQVPGHGWVSVDPVGHPLHGFAWTPPHSAIATWDVYGQQIAGDRLIGAAQEENKMEGQPSFGLFGGSDDYEWEEHDELFPTTTGEPLPWDVYGLSGFGCYADTMGIITDPGYLIEVDESDMIGDTGCVRTPMLELAPGPFALAKRSGIILDGTLGLGDDGQVYQFDGWGKFWKKLIKPGKKLAKRIAKPVLKKVEKLVGKTKVGRKIIKLKNRIAGVSLKILKPVLPRVGRWAPMLAPLVALIPGAGPILAGYMLSAGTVARLADKHGIEFLEMVKTDRKIGKKYRRAKLSGKPKDILKYQKALKKAGKKLKRKRLSKKELMTGVSKIKAHRGPKLPRKNLVKRKVLKRGTRKWKSALQAIGLRAGALREKRERRASTRKMKRGSLREMTKRYTPKGALIARPTRRIRLKRFKTPAERAMAARRRAQLIARPTRRRRRVKRFKTPAERAMAARRRAQLIARPTRRVRRVKRFKTAAERAMAARRRAQLTARPTRRKAITRATIAARRKQRRPLTARRPVIKRISTRSQRAARRVSRRAPTTRKASFIGRRRAV